jgi:hypothetical protein
VIGAEKGLWYWSNAVAVNVNDSPGETVKEEGEIEIWSNCGGNGGVVVNPPELLLVPEPPPHPDSSRTTTIE